MENQLKSFPISEISEILGFNIDNPYLKEQYPWDKLYYAIDGNIEDSISNLSLQEAVKYRLETQFVYSILLEADKALLAVPDMQKHKQFVRHELKLEWINKIIAGSSETTVNILRSFGMGLNSRIMLALFK